MMKITEIEDRPQDLINRLLEVWEGSVRATHLFLSDDEIKSIKEYVPQALNGIAHLMIAEDESGRAVAFMGIEEGFWPIPKHKTARSGDKAGTRSFPVWVPTEFACCSAS